jgi:hypothetical protein
MATPTLLLDAASAAVLGGLYAFVGNLFSRRPVSSPEALQARRAFTLWWYGLSALTLVGALRHFLAGAGILDLGLHVTLGYLLIPVLAAALWGLVYYLLFIYTGSSRWRMATLVGHAALGIVLLGLVAWMGPERVVAEDWSATIVYARELTGPPLFLVAAAILAPVLFAASAYLTLAFRVEDPKARARIFTVSGAFLLWFGSSALASAFGWTDWYWWPLAARGIAFVSTLLILLAYQPAFPWGLGGAARDDPPAQGSTSLRGPRFLPAGSREHARRWARPRPRHAVPAPA